MTLVLGFNFSHKLYLAGDTRVTRTIDQSKRLYIDNILKVFPLWGREILDQKFFNDDTITLAVAGDVSFATYLYKEIKTALNEQELNSDIRKFSDQILPFIQLKTDIWLREYKYANCALLFCGMTHNRRKHISKKKLDELIGIYKNRIEQDRLESEKFKREILPNDPTWQLIDKKMREEAGKSVLESLAESDDPTISSWIQAAIDKGSDMIEMPDSLVLGVEVKPGEGVLRKETAEWGEFIAYGGGLTKNDLPSDLISALELSHVKNPEKGPHLFEAALITSTILDIASQKSIGTIGGTVVLLSSLANGQILIQGKDVIEKDGKFVLRLHNQVMPLVPFHKFPAGLDINEKLEMSFLPRIP